MENDRAAGVRLYTDEDVKADYVISAADGRSTFFEMLGGKYGRRSMKRRYAGDLPVHSQMQLSFGVNRDLSDTPAWIIHLLEEPYRLLSEEPLDWPGFPRWSAPVETVVPEGSAGVHRAHPPDEIDGCYRRTRIGAGQNPEQWSNRVVSISPNTDGIPAAWPTEEDAPCAGATAAPRQ